MGVQRAGSVPDTRNKKRWLAAGPADVANTQAQGEVVIVVAPHWTRPDLPVDSQVLQNLTHGHTHFNCSGPPYEMLEHA